MTNRTPAPAHDTRPGRTVSGRELHVLFVAGCWYPEDDSSVSGIFIRRHAEAVARDHRVTVFHPTPASPAVRPGRRWTGSGSLRELRLVFAAGADPLRYQLGSWRAGREGLRQVVAEAGRPDLVHLHVVPSLALTLAVVGAFPGLPLVVTEHWSGYVPGRGSQLGRLRRRYTRWLTGRAAAVTTVSAHLAQVMLDHGFAGRYHVVPNVVDTELFRPLSTRRPGPFRFATVCALRPAKRVPDIIRALATVRAGGVAAELHVVGDGPDREAVAAAAATTDGVVLHGLLAGDGVARCLGDADALVMFSDYENSPCVIGEAFACGCPVIATRTGGIPELVSAERGVLVDVGRADDLTAALADLASGRRAFDQAALRRHAVATFSPPVIGRRFGEIYADSLARSQDRSSQ